MKKLLLTAFAVMTSLSLFAQGTVTFANSASTKVMVDINGTVSAAGNAYSVGLWYASPGSSDFTFLTGSTKTLNNGIFLGGKQVLTGIAGGTIAQIQVRGWDKTAASYDDAKATGKAWGDSSIFSMTLGNPPMTPDAPIVNGGFTSFTIAVPEPSTIALGLLGLAGLFLLRRRS